MAMSAAGPGFDEQSQPGMMMGGFQPDMMGGGGSGYQSMGGGSGYQSMGGDGGGMPGLGRGSMPLPPPGSAPPSQASAPRNMPMMSMPLAPPSTPPPRAQSRQQSRAPSRGASRGQSQMGGGSEGYQVFGGENEEEFGEFDYDPNFDPAWGAPQNADFAAGGGSEYGASEYGQSEYGQSEYGQSEYGQSEYSQSEYGQSEYGASEYGSSAAGGGGGGGGGAAGDPNYEKVDGKWVPKNGVASVKQSRRVGGGGAGAAVPNDWKKSMGGRWHVDSQKPGALQKFGKTKKSDAMAKNHWDGRTGGLPAAVPYAAPPPGAMGSRATVVNRRTKVLKQKRERPCGKYEVDTVAASFGDCYCGWKKLDHDKSRQLAIRQQSSRQTTRQKSRAVKLKSPSTRVPGTHTPTGRFQPAPKGRRQMPASVKRSMRRPVSQTMPSSLRSLQQTGIRMITGTTRTTRK
jgi:hypothetical protein